MSTAPTGKTWRVPFFTIWFGQAASLLGSSVVQFALVWWLTVQTRSATILAMASLVGYLPTILLGPFAGAMVDRLNRRRIMIIADAGIAAATALLGVDYILGWMQPWHIYVILLVRAIGGTFHSPAMQASTTMLVPKEQLARISGLNQTLSGLMRIVSPPLGALVVSILPFYGALGIDILTAIIAIITLLFIAIPQPVLAVAPVGNPFRTLLSDVVGGFRYVMRWQGLLMLIIIFSVTDMLLNPIASLMPLLVTGVFKGGALQLGTLESVFGVGIILSGLALSAWGGFRRRMLTVTVGFLGLGIGILTVGLAPVNAFWLVLIAIFFVGGMIVMINGPVNAIVQASVAPEVQGRVFTSMSSIASLLSPLGLAIAGPLSDAFGMRTWYIVTSVVCVAAGFLFILLPALRNLEQGHAGAVGTADEVAPTAP
jgi:MFS transporter, DHA3 family, macrolide efflux protein